VGQSCYHRYCRGLDGHLAYRAWVCADRPPDAVIPKRYADFSGCPCWPLTVGGKKCSSIGQLSCSMTSIWAPSALPSSRYWRSVLGLVLETRNAFPFISFRAIVTKREALWPKRNRPASSSLSSASDGFGLDAKAASLMISVWLLLTFAPATYFYFQISSLSNAAVSRPFDEASSAVA
jgi:hypothetical protein